MKFSQILSHGKTWVGGVYAMENTDKNRPKVRNKNYNQNLFFLLEIRIHYFLNREFSSPIRKTHPHLKCQFLPKIRIWSKSLLYKRSGKGLNPSPHHHITHGGGCELCDPHINLAFFWITLILQARKFAYVHFRVISLQYFLTRGIKARLINLLKCYWFVNKPLTKTN